MRWYVYPFLRPCAEHDSPWHKTSPTATNSKKIFTAESGIHQIIQTDNASCDAIASSPEPLARPGTPSTQETWSTKFDTIGTFYFSSKQSCQPGGSVLTVTVTNSSTISIQPQFDPVTPVQPMQLPDSGTPVTSVPPIQSTYIPPPNAVGLNPGLANGGLNGAPKPNSASSVRIGLVTIILSLLLL